MYGVVTQVLRRSDFEADGAGARSAAYELSAVACVQERVGLGERGGRLKPLEDLAGMLQDRCGLGRSGKTDQTPALAQERERLLGHDPEPLPAIGSIGVGIGG